MLPARGIDVQAHGGLGHVYIATSTESVMDIAMAVNGLNQSEPVINGHHASGPQILHTVEQSVTEELSPISSPVGNVADDAQKQSPKQRQEQKPRQHSVRTTSGSTSTTSSVYGKVPSQTVTSCSFAPNRMSQTTDSNVIIAQLHEFQAAVMSKKSTMEAHIVGINMRLVELESGASLSDSITKRDTAILNNTNTLWHRVPGMT